jgi:hypothetical protein
MSATSGWCPLRLTARDWLFCALGSAVGLGVTLPCLPAALWPP